MKSRTRGVALYFTRVTQQVRLRQSVGGALGLRPLEAQRRSYSPRRARRVHLKGFSVSRVLGAVVVLVFLALAYPVGAFGAPKTYRPNKLGDHAPNHCTHADCTLREALIAANGHAGHDKILMLGGKTYKLARAGTGEEAAKTGDLDILDDVTITHSGRRRATVDGNGIDRVFHFPGTSGATGVLKGLVI